MNLKTRRISVFVVEDEPLMRDALRLQLTLDTRTSFFGAAETVEKAISKFKLHRLERNGNIADTKEVFPDVILVDMQFRTSQGKEEIQGPGFISQIDHLRTSMGDLDLKILCLSMNLDPDVIIAAIEAGADGYLDKSLAHEGWIEAIDLVYRGFYVFSPTVSEKVMLGAKITKVDRVFIFVPEKNMGLSERAKEIAFLYWRCRMSAVEIAEVLNLTEAGVRYHLGKIGKSPYKIRTFGREIARKKSKEKSND